MYQIIGKREKGWSDSLLNINFKGRNVLQKQVLHAKVVCDEEYAYMSLQ